MSKEIQNLRQDKTIQENKYAAAKKAGDQVGMQRAFREINKINSKIVRILRGSGEDNN